jgi:hypothetical protein
VFSVVIFLFNYYFHFYTFNYFGILDFSWQEYSESLENYKPFNLTQTITTGLSTLFSKTIKHLFQTGSTKKINWLLGNPPT